MSGISGAKGWASVLVLLAVAVYWLWPDPGYGPVSDSAYEFARAIYSASREQNENRIEKLQAALIADSTPLEECEREWLLDIVGWARDGNWAQATRWSKRMMEDQVSK